MHLSTITEMKVSLKTFKKKKKLKQNLLWARWVDKKLKVPNVLSNIVCRFEEREQ